MCGRMFQTLPLKRLLQIARTKNVTNGDMHSVSYNVCPTTYIPVIKKSNLYPSQIEDPKQKENGQQDKIISEKMQEEDLKIGEQSDNQLKNDREVTFMKWGQKTNFNMLINGRIQQLTSKRTFMKHIQNRCVVIMEGYYEWKQKDKAFSFKPKNTDHFLVAGLYTDENQIIILTKDAIPSLAHIHQRMPAMLSQSEVQLWLDPKNTAGIQQIINNSLLNKDKPLWKNIGFAALAPHVNKRENKTVQCLMTIEQYNKELDKKGLMRFWGPKMKKKEEKQKKDEDEDQKQKQKQEPKQNINQISQNNPEAIDEEKNIGQQNLKKEISQPLRKQYLALQDAQKKS